MIGLCSSLKRQCGRRPSASSAASRASQIARQLLLYGRPIPMEELMDRLAGLTVERLTDLSGRLFSGKPTLTAVGPVANLPTYESISDTLTGWSQPLQKLAV